MPAHSFPARSPFQTKPVVVLLALAVAGCSRQPPPDDLFLSYWQCAEGLAKSLISVETADEYRHQPAVEDEAALDGLVPGLPRSLRDGCLDLCDQLETYQAALDEIPPDERERLQREHAALLERVSSTCANLKHRHAGSPDIIGDDWERYENALPQAATGGPR